MSNEMQARNLHVESPGHPSWGGSSAQGKSGPKPRTIVVGDGEQVEIPGTGDVSEALTQKDSMSQIMVELV